MIVDVPVGEKFEHTAAIRKYLKEFFVGYKTVTKLESVEVLNDLNANAHVDFTGDFGHETGALDFTLNADDLIKKVNAYLD